MHYNVIISTFRRLPGCAANSISGASNTNSDDPSQPVNLHTNLASRNMRSFEPDLGRGRHLAAVTHSYCLHLGGVGNELHSSHTSRIVTIQQFCVLLLRGAKIVVFPCMVTACPPAVQRARVTEPAWPSAAPR